MTDQKSPPPPEGCGERGRDLWEAVVAEFELDPRERGLLGAAARTADELALIEEALAGAGLMTTGSTGQPVATRLLNEVRAHRRLLAQLLADLHLPAEVPAGSRPRAVSRGRAS